MLESPPTRERALAVVGVAVLLALAAAPKVALPADDDVFAFMPEGTPALSAFDTMAERLHARDIVLVGVESDGLFTAERLHYLRALAEALGACPEVEHVTGLATLAVIETKEGEAAHVALIPPEIPTDPAALAALRARVLGQDYLATVVSADARATMMIVLLRRDAALTTKEAAQRVRTAAQAVPPSAGTTLHFAGAPFMEAAGGELTAADLGMLGPGMGIALLTLIALVMRSFRGTVIVIKVSAVATVTALGALGWAGARASLVASSLPLVVLLFAVAAAIALALGGSPLRVVLRAGLAAAIGFIAWRLMASAPLRELGALLTAAVAIAAVIVAFLTPALVRLWPPPSTSRSLTTPARAAAPALTWLALALGVALATQLARLAAQTDVHEDLPPSSAAGDADRFQREHFGNHLYLQVVVAGDMKDPAAIRQVAAFEDALWAVPEVVRVQSYPQVLAVVREGVAGGRALPATREELAQLAFLARANDPATRLLVDDGDRATVIQIAIAHASEEAEAAIERLIAAPPSRAQRLVALAGPDNDASPEGLAALTRALSAPPDVAALDAAKRATSEVLAKEIGEDEMVELRDDKALADLTAMVSQLTRGRDAGVDPVAFEAALARHVAADELEDKASFDKVARYLHKRVDGAVRAAFAGALQARVTPLLTRDASGDPRMRALRDQRIAATLAEDVAPAPTEPLSFTLTGEPVLMYALGVALAEDLALGLVGALVLAALALLAMAMFAERGPRVLLALVPPLAALLVLGGTLGLTGMPLDLTVPIVVAIALTLGLLAGTATIGASPSGASPGAPRPVAGWLVERMLAPAAAIFVLAFAAFGPVHRLGILVPLCAAAAGFVAVLVRPQPPSKFHPRSETESS